MINIKNLANELVKKGSDEIGYSFEVNPMLDNFEVLQIVVEDREELPIFLSVSEEQVMCISYLFKEDEIKEEFLNEINKAMLTANITMPLSSFARIDEQYVIYGSLSTKSSIDDIVNEIETLNLNALEALKAMSDYLK